MYKQMIRDFINKEISQLPFIERLWEKIDGRFDPLNKEVGELRRELKASAELRRLLEDSLRPVVLFKGDIKYPGGSVYVDYAWAEKANESLHIRVQPDCTIKLKSLTILNGLYEVIELRIANIDVIATNSGIIPKGLEIPLDMVGEISPANMIHVRLGLRK